MVNLGCDYLDCRVFGDHGGDALGAAQQVQEQDLFFEDAMFYQRLDRLDGRSSRCYDPKRKGTQNEFLTMADKKGSLFLFLPSAGSSSKQYREAMSGGNFR